jgi:type IV fimbrial biogenesis protein FimT
LDAAVGFVLGSQEGRIVLKASLHRGFTLIEAMVVLTIIALFMMLALPEMSTYLTNSRIRNTAQAFKAGLMVAQAEAIKINDQVEFVTTSAAPAFDSPLDINGKNWAVVRVNPVPRTAANNLVAFRDAAEGSTTQVTLATVGLGAGNPLTFNALGGTNQAGPVLFDFRPLGAPCTASSPVRCMGVLVSTSGRVHLCVNDPSIPATDPRSCN